MFFNRSDAKILTKFRQIWQNMLRVIVTHDLGPFYIQVSYKHASNGKEKLRDFRSDLFNLLIKGKLF